MSDAEKRTATAIARAALAGFKLQRAEGGTFTAERWGHIRHLADIDVVEQWLAMVTGKKAA